MVRTQGGTVISLQPCHLTEPSECQALVDLAVARVRGIDVLFNNAAMAFFNWLEDITNEEWNRDLREEIDLFFSHPRGVAIERASVQKCAQTDEPEESNGELGAVGNNERAYRR